MNKRSKKKKQERAKARAQMKKNWKSNQRKNGLEEYVCLKQIKLKSRTRDHPKGLRKDSTF